MMGCVRNIMRLRKKGEQVLRRREKGEKKEQRKRWDNGAKVTF